MFILRPSFNKLKGYQSYSQITFILYTTLTQLQDHHFPSLIKGLL